MPYATAADVRNAGAPAAATDAQIDAAIAEAQQRVELYTGDVFESRVLTVRALLAAGVAPLPVRVQSVSAVRTRRADGTPLDGSAYFVTSSAVRGDVDAVRLVGSGFGGGITAAALFDVTYEPVRSTLDDELAVYVTGTFGWETTPDAVRDATVQLALAELADAGVDGAGGAVNVEGDADLSTPPRVPTLTLADSGSTGSREADRLLSGYRRTTLRIS